MSIAHRDIKRNFQLCADMALTSLSSDTGSYHLIEITTAQAHNDHKNTRIDENNNDNKTQKGDTGSYHLFHLGDEINEAIRNYLSDKLTNKIAAFMKNRAH